MEKGQEVKITSNASEASQTDSYLDRSFESCTNAYDFCVHFINKQDETVDSQFVNAEDNLTLDECMTILQDKLKRPMNELVFKANLESEPLPSTTTLSEFVTSPDTDLYVYYEGLKPIIKEVEKQIKYQTLGKYSYLDETKAVKVYIPLEGIGNHNKEKIHARFLDRSLEVKIHDFQGKNYIFAVPKTQCCILVKNSKVVQKADKLIVHIAKMAESDNWHSLHKVKAIGEKDTD